jgi:uncharacterized protein YbjT (DUF2867 family)
MTLKNLLITGATGNQGGALITALQSLTPQQFNLFALTRNLSSPTSLRLANQGATVIKGDISSPTAIFTQVPSPLHGVFVVTLPGPHEKDHATTFIDAAITAGVHHIIFTSVDPGSPFKSSSSTHNGPIPILHFGIKRDIENYLIKLARKGGKEERK